MFSFFYYIKDYSLQSYIQEITELKNTVPIVWSMFTGKCFTEISTHPTGETFSIMPDKNRCQDSIFRPEGKKNSFAQLSCTTTTTINQPSVSVEQLHPQTIGN